MKLLTCAGLRPQTGFRTETRLFSPYPVSIDQCTPKVDHQGNLVYVAGTTSVKTYPATSADGRWIGGQPVIVTNA